MVLRLTEEIGQPVLWADGSELGGVRDLTIRLDAPRRAASYLLGIGFILVCVVALFTIEATG